MPKAKSKAIIVSEFAILDATRKTSDKFSQEEIKESMGKAAPSISDLDKIKVPAGGSIMWEVLDEHGEETAVKSFEAIILAAMDVRVFYATKYDGGNEPPDCMSLDMVHGLVGEDCPADVTGECATCPKAQWGSATNDKGEPTNGKACSERKQMLIFRPNDIAPVLLSAPPSSLGEVQAYVKRLPATRDEVHWSCVTKFSLKKEKNPNGIVYSQVVLEFVRGFNDDERATARRLRAVYVPAVEAEPPVVPE
jgi:hypothetical protein